MNQRMKKIAALLGIMLAVSSCGAASKSAPETPTDPTQFDPFSMEPYVFQESDTLPEKANPVNLKETRVIWNGRDITEDKAYRQDPDTGAVLEELRHWVYQAPNNSPYVGTAKKGWPPCDGFSIAVPEDMPEAEDPSQIPVGTPVRFAWIDYITQSGGGLHYLTFGCNDKKIKTLSFTGLPENSIEALSPDGLTLRFDTPGEYTLTYEVTDTEGVTRESPGQYTFVVL